MNLFFSLRLLLFDVFSPNLGIEFYSFLTYQPCHEDCSCLPLEIYLREIQYLHRNKAFILNFSFSASCSQPQQLFPYKISQGNRLKLQESFSSSVPFLFYQDMCF